MNSAKSAKRNYLKSIRKYWRSLRISCANVISIQLGFGKAILTVVAVLGIFAMLKPVLDGYKQSETVANPICSDMIGLPHVNPDFNNAPLIASLQSVIVDSMKALLSGIEAVALIDYPDYNNRGDYAIWAGEEILLEWLNIRVVHRCTFIHIPPDEFSCNSETIRAALQPFTTNGKGMLLYSGGGNLGDMYSIEDMRQKFIAKLHDIPSILLPHSLFFHNEKNIIKSANAYAKATNFTILIRDIPSLKVLKRYYKTVQTYLVPDMALMLGHRHRPVDPIYDILVLKRVDIEQKAGAPQVSNIDWPSDIAVKVSDWPPVYVDKNITEEFYVSRAKRHAIGALRYLSLGKVVITDRFHAHTLSLLLSIPHVHVETGYGKTNNIHQMWYKGAKGVETAATFEEAKDKALKMLHAYNTFEKNKHNLPCIS